MCDHDQPSSAAPNPRWRPSRRGLLKAGAAAAAVAAVGAAGDFAASSVRAEGGIQTQRWSAADNQGVRAASADGWQIAKCDFRFYAVGSSWDGSNGAWPTIEFGFSDDGANWTSSAQARADEDGGQPDRDGRIFTNLVMLGGATYARYRTLDGNGAPASVSGVQLFFIDATGGPHFGGVSAAALPALQQPTIISRSGWGCPDPNGATDQYGVIWPPEYQTVEHVIIHHADTPNYQDGGTAVRSIYAYHTWDRGWGDIGYNYLVDYQGNIYEGRFGGTNVVGGHAFQYAFGSSGICAVGTFDTVDVTSSQKASLINISAWVGRALNPLGASDFHEVRNLPTISGHRDTNQTECPGDMLYADLPYIRQQVANILGSTSHTDPGTPGPGPTFKTGDNVVFNVSTKLYANPDYHVPGPFNNNYIVYTAAQGAYGGIDGAPRTGPDGNQWQAVRTFNSSNHVAANLIEGYCYPSRLSFAPAGNPPAPIYEEGDVVTALQSMDLRRSAGEAQNSPYTLNQGDILAVSGPCVAATGSQWVSVDGPQNATGYVKQETVALVKARKLTLNPTSGLVGANVTAAVSGMPTSRTITITVGGSAAKTFTTDSSGNGSTSFTVPNVGAGAQTVAATVGVASASASFTVTGTPTPTPTPPDFSGRYPMVGGSQSSDSQSNSRVRDGDFNTYWRTNNTGVKSSAWVAVDLGSVKPIDNVQWVMGATGMAKAFTIQVSSDGISWTNIGTGTDSGVMVLQTATAPSGTMGRYVRFYFTNPNSTATLGGIAEIAVYPGQSSGSPSPTPTPPDFTGAYPLVSGGSSPDSQNNYRVRDGDFNTYWRTNNTGVKSSAWVYVDLGSAKPIGEVRWVMGVTGMAKAFSVQLSSNGTSWQTITTGTDSPAGQVQSYVLPSAITARYVMFAFTNPNSTPTLGGIAEIGVFPGSGPSGQGDETTQTPTPVPTPDLSGSYPLVNGASSPDSQSNTRVRDRNFDTYWRTNNTGVKSSAWVSVDLGSVQPIGEIRWWMGATGLANDFTIQVSTDNGTWTDVGTGTDAPVGQQQSQVIQNGINGRYVRFFFRNPNSTATLGGIAEIAVYPGTVKANSAASPSPSPSATGTPIPTNTPSATPVPTETGTPIPTETPTQTPIPTETPTATGTPIPTDTPTDTPTDAGSAGNAAPAAGTP